MKRTISRLLQINPIPISSLKSKQVEIRLPPTSSSSSSLSSATSSSSSNSPIATASKANKLSTPVLDNLFEHQRKCIEAESTGQNQEGMVWPRNLRLERQVNKRELYWKENDQEWVTLISEDGYSFVLDYKCAMGSGMIKNMLSGGFSEGENNTAKILARGVVLEKVVEYLIWKTKYEDVKESEVPSFQNRIPPEISLELLMCADFLEV